ncbi:MAG: hypothetical protein ACSW8C_05560, partial [bacterium]
MKLSKNSLTTSAVCIGALFGNPPSEGSTVDQAKPHHIVTIDGERVDLYETTIGFVAESLLWHLGQCGSLNQSPEEILAQFQKLVACMYGEEGGWDALEDIQKIRGLSQILHLVDEARKELIHEEVDIMKDILLRPPYVLESPDEKIKYFLFCAGFSPEEISKLPISALRNWFEEGTGDEKHLEDALWPLAEILLTREGFTRTFKFKYSHLSYIDVLLSDTEKMNEALKYWLMVMSIFQPTGNKFDTRITISTERASVLENKRDRRDYLLNSYRFLEEKCDKYGVDFETIVSALFQGYRRDLRGRLECFEYSIADKREKFCLVCMGFLPPDTSSDIGNYLLQLKNFGELAGFLKSGKFWKLSGLYDIEEKSFVVNFYGGTGPYSWALDAKETYDGFALIATHPGVCVTVEQT